MITLKDSRYMRSLLFLLSFILCGASPAAAQPAPGPGFVVEPAAPVTAATLTETPGVRLAEYRLAVGDTIRVVVFGHADTSGTFEVGQDGSIVMPLLAQVPAEGKTALELEREIREALDRDYLVDPNVSIEVLSYRPIYILGQVEHPGSYEYEVGLDVRKAVALAGGYTSRANRANMTLIRKVGESLQELDASPSTPVLPGDTVEVDRRWF